MHSEATNSPESACKKEVLESMSRNDDAFKDLATLRTSPDYDMDRTKKDVFAMIRQLGMPTSLSPSASCADMRWFELLAQAAEEYRQRRRLGRGEVHDHQRGGRRTAAP
jgi:hypothetical protein